MKLRYGCPYYLLLFLVAALRGVSATDDYARIDALFQKHCLDCHNAKDAEGQLILESHELLMKGGEDGPVVVPGRSAESILVKSVEGSFEKDGKRKIMPPGAKRKKLDSDEIALIKNWIDAGAQGPTGPAKRLELVTPKVPLKTAPRVAINALAFLPQSRALAVARSGGVEVWPQSRLDATARPETDEEEPATPRLPAFAMREFRGNVYAVLAAPGSDLFFAGGEPGLSGEVQHWTPHGLARKMETPGDALYCAALSSDGKTLAAGSYDAKIWLMDIAEPEAKLRTFTGHNGAVFGLAFRPDGKILASASADRTVKLWNVATGKRTDTLSQPLKDQYAVVFSADGKRLFGAGADSRIRVWQISETAAETTNPLIESHFAHEGTILRLALSPRGRRLLSCADDRSVKIWDAETLKQQRVIERQPDWVSAAVFLAEDRIAVGRMDGSMDLYDVNTGQSVLRAEAKK